MTFVACAQSPGRPWRRASTLALLGAAQLMIAAGPGAAATVVKTFNGWTLYAETAQQQICFLASTAAETQPPGLKRDAALLYVSAWPKEGVRSEVSVRLGFPVRKASEPTVSVTGPGSAAPASFKMFVKDDRAYVSDATQELKLLEAMKKGTRLVVQAVSERGTAVTDTFSLAGVSAGLQALAGGCQ